MMYTAQCTQALRRIVDQPLGFSDNQALGFSDNAVLPLPSLPIPPLPYFFLTFPPPLFLSHISPLPYFFLTFPPLSPLLSLPPCSDDYSPSEKDEDQELEEVGPISAHPAALHSN